MRICQRREGKLVIGMADRGAELLLVGGGAAECRPKRRNRGRIIESVGNPLQLPKEGGIPIIGL